jgi:site-specific DNA recombinase
MKFDGYIRVSRIAGREGASFLAPDLQRETIERLAAAKKIELGEIVEELDVSGARKIDDRELGRLVRKVEAGESGGILVWKVSRFSRDQLDCITVARQIGDAGGRLIGEDLDSHQPNGKALLGFLAGFAEEERDARRAGWDYVQRSAVERGIHIASRTPTGYRKRAADKRLERDPKAARVIAELFRRRAAGEGWRQLADFLDASGIRGPYGNVRWSQGAAAKIIRNRVYLGEARSGKYVNPSAHEPIVSRAEWEAAQSARPGASIRNGDGLLLAGLVRCAGCRYLVKADHMTDRDGGRLGLYRCRARHAAGECPARASTLARVLDPFVEQQFLTALGPKGPLAKASVSSRQLDAARQHVEATEAELVAYRDSGAASVIGQESFLSGLQTRQRDLDEARSELAETRDRAGFSQALPAEPLALVEMWPSLTVTERRELLQAAIDAVVIRSGRNVPISDRVVILWRGQAPADFPRRGLRTPLASFAWPDESEGDARVTSSENGKPRSRKRTRSGRR